MNDDNDLRLEVGDRIQEIARRTGAPGAYSPALRNLNIIWHSYANYLRDALRHGLAPGIPIYLVEDSFHLKRLLVGPKWYTRDWFEGKTPGGTHVQWVHPAKDEGYQWWIMSWSWKNKLLTITVTHWMIHHDEHMRRNTIYFVRQFTFHEDPKLTDFPSELVESNTDLEKIPRPHRERVMELGRHATQYDDDDWVLVLAPYSFFGTMFDLQNMIKRMDIGDTMHFYMDREFKSYWYRRVLDALWGKDGETEWRPTQDQVDDLGFLKDDWYVPKSEHFLDRQRYERVFQEWLKFREWYEKAHKIYLGIVTDEKTFDEMKDHFDTQESGT